MSVSCEHGVPYGWSCDRCDKPIGGYIVEDKYFIHPESESAWWIKNCSEDMFRQQFENQCDVSEVDFQTWLAFCERNEIDIFSAEVEKLI